VSGGYLAPDDDKPKQERDMTKLERNMTDLEVAQFEREQAKTRAIEWFDELESVLRGKARDVREYRARFEQSFDEPSGISSSKDVLSWVITSVSSLQINMRLDMVVSHGVRLELAERAFKSAQKQAAAKVE
jgi:hypothetical protein